MKGRALGSYEETFWFQLTQLERSGSVEFLGHQETKDLTTDGRMLYPSNVTFRRLSSHYQRQINGEDSVWEKGD